MSLPTTYTIGNLQNDAAALSKSVKDALTVGSDRERRAAWTDATINAAKIVSGMAYLAANDPAWGGMVGSASTLAALGLSATRIKNSAMSGGVDAIKAGDVLGVVGGISDLASTLPSTCWPARWRSRGCGWRSCGRISRRPAFRCSTSATS